jgi:hypothetical protein
MISGRAHQCDALACWEEGLDGDYWVPIPESERFDLIGVKPRKQTFSAAAVYRRRPRRSAK